MTVESEASPRERTPLWDALVGLLLPGVALATVYAFGGTWSVGQTFGGESDDGWVDFAGNPIPRPPLVVDVEGHPAPWVFAALVLLLVAAAVWVAHATGRVARRRAWIGTTVAAVFIVTVILVFTGLQTTLIHAAFDRGSTHPPILGDATVTVSRMVESG